MKRFIRTGSIALALSCGNAAPSGDFGVDHLMEEWGSVERLRVEFTEKRHNPFRRIPQNFKGAIYMEQGRGITIHYSKPSDLRLHFSGDRLLRRRGESGWAPLDLPEEHADLVKSLFRIFYWEPDWVDKHWEMDGTPTESGWGVTLVPRDGSTLDGMFKRITITGKDQDPHPRKIHLFRSDRKEIEIFIDSADEPAAFSREEIADNFPQDG